MSCVPAAAGRNSKNAVGGTENMIKVPIYCEKHDGNSLLYYVIVALSQHSPRCWKRRRHEQGVGKAAWARSDD